MPLKISEQISKPDFKNFFHPDPILVRISDFTSKVGESRRGNRPTHFLREKPWGRG